MLDQQSQTNKHNNQTARDGQYAIDRVVQPKVSSRGQKEGKTLSPTSRQPWLRSPSRLPTYDTYVHVPPATPIWGTIQRQTDTRTYSPTRHVRSPTRPCVCPCSSAPLNSKAGTLGYESSFFRLFSGSVWAMVGPLCAGAGFPYVTREFNF